MREDEKHNAENDTETSNELIPSEPSSKGEQAAETGPAVDGASSPTAQTDDRREKLWKILNSKITVAVSAALIGALLGTALGATITADGARDAARITADENRAARQEASQAAIDKVKREAADAFLDAVSEYATLTSSVVGAMQSNELPSAAIMNQFTGLDKKMNDAFSKVQSSKVSADAKKQGFRLVAYATDISVRINNARLAAKTAYDTALATPEGPNRVNPEGAARWELFGHSQTIGVQRLGHVGDCGVGELAVCSGDIRKQAADGSWPAEPGRSLGEVKELFRSAVYGA